MKHIKLYLSIISVLLACANVLHAQTDMELMSTKSITLKHQQPIKIPKLYAVFCPDCFLYIEGTDDPEILEYSLKGYPRFFMLDLSSGCRDCIITYFVDGVPTNIADFTKESDNYLYDINEIVLPVIYDKVSYNLEVPANCRFLDLGYFASIGKPVFLNPIIN